MADEGELTQSFITENKQHTPYHFLLQMMQPQRILLIIQRFQFGV